MSRRASSDESENPKLDDVDLRILEALTDNGRMSVNELAAKVNVSRATAYNRFERLQRAGVITGIGARVDPAKVGLSITALILISAEQGSWPKVRDALLHVPGLEYLAMTSGGFDFVALVRVPDIQTLRDVVLVELHGLEQIRSTQTIFVLDELRLPLVPPPSA